MQHLQTINKYYGPTCLECEAPRESQMQGKCNHCIDAMWDRILANDSRYWHSELLQKENYLAMYRNGSKYPQREYSEKVWIAWGWSALTSECAKPVYHDIKLQMKDRNI